MKTVIGSIGLSLIGICMSAGTAVAQTGSNYPVSPSPTTVVQSSSGGGTAFTGSNLAPAVVVFIVLVAVGIAALLWSRRSLPSR
jgi:hypothetical protein